MGYERSQILATARIEDCETTNRKDSGSNPTRSMAFYRLGSAGLLTFLAVLPRVKQALMAQWVKHVCQPDRVLGQELFHLQDVLSFGDLERQKDGQVVEVADADFLTEIVKNRTKMKDGSSGGESDFRTRRRHRA